MDATRQRRFRAAIEGPDMARPRPGACRAAGARAQGNRHLTDTVIATSSLAPATLR